VSVDARIDTTTGISARDCARTVRLPVDEATTIEDLCRAGHVVPTRVGQSSPVSAPAAIADLAELAIGVPAGVYAELVRPSGEVADLA
jgi:3,4-dihydroxy 2-butanone 4-phosphate synthase/GTP cyclohydrolase II